MIKDCQRGHNGHDTMFVNTNIGKLEIYKVGNTKGKKYCPADDVISKALFDNGEYGSQEINNILKKGKHRKHKLFVDFGAHIGWYSIMAAKLGYDVVAFEGQPDNLLLLENNTLLQKVNELVFIEPTWVDKSMPPATLNSGQDDYYKEIWLVKINIDGAEKYALKSLDNLLKENKIKNLVVKFYKEYDVKKITDYGYSLKVIDGLHIFTI